MKSEILIHIKRMLLYFGVEKQQFEKVQERIDRANRTIILIFASIALIFLTTLYGLSLFQGTLSSSRPFYLLGLVFTSLIIILAKFLSGEYHRVLNFCIFLSIFTFMAYGILIGVVSRPEQQTVTFMVMLILLPLIFVVKPWMMALNNFIYMLIFTVLALKTKTGAVLSVDVTDTYIYGILGIISAFFINSAKVRGFVLERKLHSLSETDQLTRLNNRNSYEWKLNSYKTCFKDCLSCIYIDVNGLHALNNSKGHDAGDEMLKFIAATLKSEFGRRDTFRVGGDEFIAFVSDMDENLVQERIAHVIEIVEAEGYHIAAGYEMISKGNSDVVELVRRAETNMYKAKSEYYKFHDRRH